MRGSPSQTDEKSDEMDAVSGPVKKKTDNI